MFLCTTILKLKINRYMLGAVIWSSLRPSKEGRGQKSGNLSLTKKKNIQLCFHKTSNNFQINGIKFQFFDKISMYIRGCQIGMQEPQLCAKPRHFCKLDVATSRIAFLDLQIQAIEGAM